MKSQMLSQFPMVWLSVTALVIFFVFFVVMVARTLSRARRAQFENFSQLPLEEGTSHVEQ